MLMRADTVYRQMGEIGPDIIQAQGSEDALYQILSATTANALANPQQTSV